MNKMKLVKWFLLGLIAGIASCVFLSRPRVATEYILFDEEKVRQDYKNELYPTNFFEHIKLVPTVTPIIELKNLDVGISRSLVKPAYAREYSYTDHSGKPYYDQIITSLKAKFVNWQDAAELIARESGFNPKAVNSSSGACGLVQANPCSKLGCSLDDIDCQLDWFWNYIAGRYGTITKALEFHNQKGWY